MVGRGVCSHRGLGPELKSLNAPPLPTPDPELGLDTLLVHGVLTLLSGGVDTF